MRGERLLFPLVALAVAAGVVYGFNQQPSYTDAFYYFNAAERLVTGRGLTDAYLWNYIGMPDSLPVPSHTYWMPGASLAAALGMWALRAPGVYWAAQAPFVLMLALLGVTAYGLGWYMGETRRHAWAAGLIVLFGGFFARYWGAVETFTPFAVFGAGALVTLGRGLTVRRWYWFALAGGLSAAGHLTRADGLLLVLAGGAALFWPWDRALTWRWRLGMAAVLVLAYLLAMARGCCAV